MLHIGFGYRLYLLAIVLAVAFVTSCSDDDSLASRGLETVEMPISISIPAEGFVNPTDVGIGDEAVTPASATTRALGDPGTYEQFHLPQYIYLFLCNESTNGTKSVIYQKIEIPTDNELASAWEKTVWGNDSMYTYKGTVSINLPLNRSKGKIYAAASYKPLHTTNASSSMPEDGKSNHLSFNCAKPNKFDKSNPREYINESKTYPDSTEDAVKNIIFSNITLRNNMQDVYSTPYNKMENGVYYGTITDYASNVPNINIVLYHVATKVDVQWSIDEHYQGTADWAVPTVKKSNPSAPLDSFSASTSGSTYLPAHTYWTKYECETMVNSKGETDKLFFSLVELRDLPKYGCFLFRPLETGSNSNLSSYKIRLIGSETTPQYSVNHDNTGAYVASGGYKTYYYHLDEKDYGMKYHGRLVAYVMPKVYNTTAGTEPYANNFIKMRLLCNNYTTSTSDGSSIYNEDHATKGYNTYVKISKPTTGDKIFTPWIRVFINVDKSQKAQNVMKITEEPTMN